MIRVWRGPEPWELHRSRARALPRLRQKVAAGEALKRSDLVYDGAREPLMRDQHFKCAYCDQRPTRSATVEHFRPALAATGDGQPRVQPSGYWWLGMSWENMLYTCSACNTSKGERFDLEGSSVCLMAEEVPPGEERPRWLDPAGEDPSEHVCFFPEGSVGADGAGRWRPTARDGSARGYYTLDKLGLDDDQAYFTNIDLHVEDVIRPRLRDVRAAQRHGAGVAAAWREACALVEPEREFALLSRDVIDWCFKAEIDAGQLTLPRPWRHPPAQPRQRTAQEERVAALTAATREALASLHKQSDEGEKLGVIARICGDAPRGADELAALLGVEASTMRGYLKKLRGAGRLSEAQGLWSAPSP